jgi:hypothetical protein
VSRRFPKKSFRTPLPPRSKRGGRTCVRVEKPVSENRVASCIPPFRTFPGVRYGRARHRLFRNRRYGRMHVHRTQRKRCSRKGVCSGPSAWRPASVEAPVAGVDKVADAANSAAPVRMRLRSWLRVAKVARDRCDRFWTMEKRRRECAGCRPQSARVSERYSLMARRQFADLGLLDRFVWHGASAPSANVWR